MAYKKIRLLYAADDRDALEPILAQLHTKGVKCTEKAGGILLAVLSQNLYNDPEKTNALLNQLSTGARNILPLQLDSTPIPEAIMNALFATNVIPAVGREPELIAQRIIDALPAPKNPLPKFFIAGALVLAAIIGIFLWRGQTKDQPEPEVQTEPQAVIPLGLTEDELANIKCVAIMGDQFTYYFEDDGTWSSKLWDLASSEIVPPEVRWYSHEDGSEVQLQEYDLSFLSMMPNLQELHMAMVKVTAGPDLSGLEFFRNAVVMDCEMDDVSWLANSNIQHLTVRCEADWSPFSGSQKLESVVMDVASQDAADFSHFSPPSLKELSLSFNDMTIVPDLAGLAGCRNLTDLQLLGGLYPDLSFLSNANSMERLDIRSNYALQDISTIGNMNQLQDLTVDDCTAVFDFSPIGGCEALERIVLGGNINNRSIAHVQNVSFLVGLTRLSDISLYNVSLPDLGFLNALSQHQQSLKLLDIAGTVADWSALGAFGQYEYLYLDSEYTPFDMVLPHLTGTKVVELTLRNFTGANLSSLPEVTGSLEIANSNIQNLATLPQNWATPSLRLRNCPNLSSLDGLQAAQWASGEGMLYIYNCPRLSDWSALDGMELNELSVIGGYSVPDLGTFRVKNLRLDSVGDVEDLTFFDNMSADQDCNITLAGMENVNNLQPLSRFHGTSLAVPPHLAEQAEDLVKAGNFSEFSIEYPQGGWELDNSEISLLSLEELETLPKALLRRVGRLAIAGDMLVDLDKLQVIERPDRNGGAPQLMVYDRETREMIPIDPAQGIITDLSQLQDLTGLRELQLWGQPLESIEGIQNLTELRRLKVEHCPNLKDASPAFTLQNLGDLSFRYCPIGSIRGIQNLPGLWSLDISCTKVTDLSPLAGSSFSQGIAQAGGFSLSLEGLSVTDLSVLAGIDVFTALDVSGLSGDLWLPLLEGKPVYDLQAAGCFDRMNGSPDVNSVLAELISSHPELTVLNVSENLRLTDVSAALQLINLRTLTLSHTMEEAIASLGEGYSFRLSIV